MFSPKRGCRWPALAAGRNQLTNTTLAALFVPADTQRVKKAPGVPGLEVTKHLEGELLDAPIVSQRTNEARRGSRKRPDRRG